jgi:hypothetical protein
MDQMILNVICKGSRKPEQIKHHHVERFVPYCREFLTLLQKSFGAQWADPTPKNSEPYRRLYVHGWPFALKAIALAYHEAMRHEIEPLGAGLGLASEHSTPDELIEADKKAVEEAQQDAPEPALPLEELQDRLAKIDWHRYRKHWIDITGHKLDKEAKKKTREIKDGTENGRMTIVEGQAQNTAATIGFVLNKILSNTWTDLCSDIDAK